MAEIILMEDSPSLRRILVRYLRDADHVVTAFEDGLASRDEALLQRADVLVTDLSMPRIDGRQVLNNTHLLAPDLPVIVTTGIERFADPVLDRAFGYLQKPFEEDDLLALIDRAVEVRRREDDDKEFEKESYFAIPPDREGATPMRFCAGLPPLSLSERLKKRLTRLTGRFAGGQRGRKRETRFITDAPETTTLKD